MKRILPLLFGLFLFAGCATEGYVTTGTVYYTEPSVVIIEPFYWNAYPYYHPYYHYPHHPYYPHRPPVVKPPRHDGPVKPHVVNPPRQAPPKRINETLQGNRNRR